MAKNQHSQRKAAETSVIKPADVLGFASSCCTQPLASETRLFWVSIISISLNLGKITLAHINFHFTGFCAFDDLELSN